MVKKTKKSIQKKTGFDPKLLLGEKIILGSHTYEIIDILNDQGQRAFTYKAKCEDIEHEVCCKFYFKELVGNNWIYEIKKPNSIKSDNFSTYINDGEHEFKDIKFKWIFWDWFDGISLKNYILNYPDRITINFLKDFTEWVLKPLNELAIKGSSHGDLHPGNIMIKEAGEENILPGEKKFIIIDFGINASSQSLEERNDFKSVAMCLSYVARSINSNELIPKEKRYYDRYCQHFLKLLDEVDPQRDETAYQNPKELYNRFQKLQQDAQLLDQGDQDDVFELTNVFEVLSADRFPENSPLLWQLYYHSKDLYDQLLGIETIVLTGPRGCGKTMFLRNMALKTRVTRDDMTIEKFQSENFVGFYLSSFELWNTFPKRKLDDIKTPEQVADSNFQKRATHFFHLCYLEEIFSSLTKMKEKFGTVTTTFAQEKNIVDFISNNFRDIDVSPEKDQIKYLSLTISKWRIEYKKELNIDNVYEDLDFLRNLCLCLKNNIPILKNKNIFFLLDDYSEGKITKALQLILNRIIFQRVSEFQFKVGAEKESIMMKDIDGPLEPSRTFIEYDLGFQIMESGSSVEKAKLIKSILNNRLKHTKNVTYENIEEILGDTKYESFNQLAKVIRKEIKNNNDEVFKKPYYHGFNHLYNLCSGDIAAIISLMQRIFQEGKFDPSLESNSIPLSYVHQNKAIVKYSRTFLDKVGGEQKYSEKCRNIAKGFGEMSAWKLKNQLSDNQGSKFPFQTLRMEVYDDQIFDDDTAREIFKHLLRYGVLIQDQRGFSQGDNISYRLYLRRLFAPNFRLTFSNRDCIRLHMNEFVQFLLHPNKTTKSIIDRWKSNVDEKQTSIAFPKWKV